jgi:hypothetical protein
MDKNEVVGDDRLEHVKNKSDADLQTIIDSYANNAAHPMRQAAMIEKFNRNEKKIRFTNVRSWIGLVLAIISIALSIANYFRHP